MVVADPPSPMKRKEAVLPAEPKEPLQFEGLESRTPLISNFAIGMKVEEPDGQVLSVPPLEIKNGFATQHSLQIPPNASSITIEFPLRMLNKKAKRKGANDAALGDGDVSMSDSAPVNGTEGEQPAANGDVNGEKGEAEPSLTWPWIPELSFNGKVTQATWSADNSFLLILQSETAP